MTMQFSQLAAQARSGKTVDAALLRDLRKLAWNDGAIDEAEADALFALNDALDERSEEWTDFFVEALCEYVVNQQAPRGYVSQENADWLIARIDHDGHFGTMAECELLVRVFETARNVPANLKVYAIERIEQAVLDGEGPTRDGSAMRTGCITAAEARIMRRAVFAPASERPAAVGKLEAEMLFRLKDATVNADNAPEWRKLFVQGVGNYLMGFADENAQISRSRAAELEAFVTDTGTSVGGFLSRMVRAFPGSAGAMHELMRGGGDPAADRKASVDAQAEIDASEKRWLDALVHADGEVDDYERALIDFIAECRAEG